MFSKVVEQRRKEADERLFLQSWRHGCKAKQCGELCRSSRKHCFLIGRFMSSFMRNHHYFMGQWLIKIRVFCIVIFSQSECTVEVMDQWSAQLMNKSRTLVNGEFTSLFSILKLKNNFTLWWEEFCQFYFLSAIFFIRVCAAYKWEYFQRHLLLKSWLLFE